jgi:hypothetical protein
MREKSSSEWTRILISRFQLKPDNVFVEKAFFNNKEVINSLIKKNDNKNTN